MIRMQWIEHVYGGYRLVIVPVLFHFTGDVDMTTGVTFILGHSWIYAVTRTFQHF